MVSSVSSHRPCFLSSTMTSDTSDEPEAAGPPSYLRERKKTRGSVASRFDFFSQSVSCFELPERTPAGISADRSPHRLAKELSRRLEDSSKVLSKLQESLSPRGREIPGEVVSWRTDRRDYRLICGRVRKGERLARKERFRLGRRWD
jgi:hypothetical protein